MREHKNKQGYDLAESMKIIADKAKEHVQKNPHPHHIIVDSAPYDSDNKDRR